VPLAERPVREPGVTIAGVVIRLVVAAAAYAVETATDNQWLETAAQIVSGATLITLAGQVHPITWIRQRLAGSSPESPRPQ
jgi:hypothetical protein